MNGITVCVEFDDLLAITLPRNAQHFERVVVVTAPTDKATIRVAAQVPNAELYVTDAFYRDGAHFNKGLALEEGFDALGRKGWIIVWDADIVMPSAMRLSRLELGYLYTPRRRMCRTIADYTGQADWSQWPVYPDQEHAGFFQLFRAEDPVLRSRPWYGVNWTHAGGCDSEFQGKWPGNHKVWLPFFVLHLGEEFANWHGRCQRRIDGSLPPDATARRDAQQEMYRARKRFGFEREKLPNGS